MMHERFCVRTLAKDERGNIAPLVVMVALVLCVVLAFSVDQAIAYAAKARQEQALDAARATCMDASFALVAKHAEYPGREVAGHMTAVLEKAGLSGRVQVWFYEVPAGEIVASRRLWGIAVQVEEDSPTVFARGYGIESIPVASHRVMVAEPFSDTRTWRPLHTENGCFSLLLGQTASELTFVPIGGLDGYPRELMEELHEAKERATGTALARRDGA